MGMKKLNTIYHPHTDGLVEHFNRTLLDMLAKSGRQNGTSVYHLSCLLIEQAHRSVQENLLSTYLMYGTDYQWKLPCAHHQVSLC